MSGAATSAAAELLPPEILAGLGGLDVVARTIVRGSIGGLHRSAYVGAGEEFSRHRAYQQGDDVRRLDWRLYARSDRLFVRLYREESNLQSFLVLDTSASMAFSGGEAVSKFRYAQFLAAALSHLMLRVGDGVGLAGAGEAAPVLLVPPRNRRGHLHDLLLTLEGLSAGLATGADQGHSGSTHDIGSHSIARGMDAAGGALRRGGRVILLSDLIFGDDGDSLVESVGRLRARGDEVIVIRIVSPLELGVRAGSAARYFDPELPQHEVAAVPGMDPGFRGRVQAYYDTLRARLEEQGAEYMALDNSQPLVPTVGEWLRKRKGFDGA